MVWSIPRLSRNRSGGNRNEPNQEINNQTALDSGSSSRSSGGSNNEFSTQMTEFSSSEHVNLEEELSTEELALWSNPTIQIGVTNVSLLENVPKKVIVYQIEIRFLKSCRKWLIRRVYGDFLCLHTLLMASYGIEMNMRHIRLPKLPRITIKGFGPNKHLISAKNMRPKLNSYMHKLLEIPEIHESTIFRRFFRVVDGDSDSTYYDPILSITDTRKFQQPKTNSSTCGKSSLIDNDSNSDDKHNLLSESTKILDSIQINDDNFQEGGPNFPDDGCDRQVLYGHHITLRTCGGLPLVFTKRSSMSKSKKAAAVAAGVAGVALTGPFAALLAAGAVGGGIGNYQYSKSYCLALGDSGSDIDSRSNNWTRGEFICESAEMFSSPNRNLKYGDIIFLHSRSLKKKLKIAVPHDVNSRGYLMSTGEDARYVRLRVVLPDYYRRYVESGGSDFNEKPTPVRCGDFFYLQIVLGEWTEEILGLHKGFVATGSSPIAFKLTIENNDHSCRSNEDTIPLLRSICTSQITLKVMTYNVWLLPDIIMKKLSPYKKERVERIPLDLPDDIDVIIFTEAFCSKYRDVLLAGMKKRGYYYETMEVGNASMSGKKALGGGVLAVSKFPIEYVDQIQFGSISCGDDSMADKGALYFQIRKQGEIIHIFGTHLQAWDSLEARKTRVKQIAMLSDFIYSKKILRDDILIIAGDMNVNKLLPNNKMMDYFQMLKILRAIEPPEKGVNVDDVPSFTDNNNNPLGFEITHSQEKSIKENNAEPESIDGSIEIQHTGKCSFNPDLNFLASKGLSSSGVKEHLDYVMYSKDHRVPESCWTEVLELSTSDPFEGSTSFSDENGRKSLRIIKDLSDHFPVVAEFKFNHANYENTYE